MEKKNYTLDCKWVGEVNSENIKEMANVMTWNCCPCTYKDDEVTAVASASAFGKLFVTIGEKSYEYALNSKRVSAKMGKEIIDNILKAVAEYKADSEAFFAAQAKVRDMGKNKYNGFASEEQYEAVMSIVKEVIKDDYDSLEYFSVNYENGGIVVCIDDFVVALDYGEGIHATYKPIGEPMEMGGNVFGAISNIACNVKCIYYPTIS